MACGGGCGGSCVTCVANAGGAMSSGGCGPLRQRMAQRLAPRVDKIRQRLSTFGLRPYLVYLVWTRWDGEERGEGEETELRRIQILPTPLVEDLSAVSLSPMSAGILPVGSIRISQISAQLTADNLTGHTIPGQAYFNGCGLSSSPSHGTPGSLALTPGQQIGAAFPRTADHISQPIEFFYELVEDVTGTAATAPGQRQKCRLSSVPFKRPNRFDWVILTERVSEDRDRFARSQIGIDHEV